MLSLPRLPVCWGGQAPRPVFPGCVRCGRRVPARTGATMRALASRCWALWGWREGAPGGGALCRCEGRLSAGALPPPTARSLGGLSGSATHVLNSVLWARVCRVGGPAPFLLPCMRSEEPRVAGLVGGRPGRVALHRCEARLVSGDVPLSAARPFGRAARISRPVFPVRCPGPPGSCSPVVLGVNFVRP